MLVLIGFSCVTKVFKYCHIIELIIIFICLNEALRLQILCLEKTNNNFA